jgi:hypothetical protein
MSLLCKKFFPNELRAMQRYKPGAGFQDPVEDKAGRKGRVRLNLKSKIG